jgi:hypothetical protein
MDGSYGCRPRPDRGLALSALGNQTLIGLFSCLGQEVSQYPVFRAPALARVPVCGGAFRTLRAA